MIKSVFWVAMLLTSALNAQELLPELAAPAAKHKAAEEALDKQRQEAVAKAVQPYVSALDGVEKSATAAGQVSLVAAVVKEREAAVAGKLEAELPAGLPKAKLQSTRKALLAKLEQFNADCAKRKQQAVAEHLRALATLQAKAASNPELAKQLAAEKAALLGGGSVAAGNGATASNASRGKNVVENGDFEKIVDGKPEGWDKTDCLTVETEGKNTFVRFKAHAVNTDAKAGLYSAGYYSCLQAIALSKGAKSVCVSAKIRTKDCVILSKKTEKTPKVTVAFKNSDGKLFRFVMANWNQKNGPWKTIQAEGPVPAEAVEAYVDFENGHCPGQIDFDDIEVTFK
jgi:hypothetical protein